MNDLPKISGFQDIKSEVLTRIHSGVWPQGSLLPTEQDLAEEFGCARATVNRALRELAEQGVIDRKRKSGTRVVTNPVRQAKLEIAVVRHTIEEQNATYRYALVRRAMVEAADWLAAYLHLPQAHPMLHLECMHYANDRPFQLEERWINVAAVPQAVEADFSTTGPNEWLLKTVPYTNADITFSALSADQRTADFLAVPTGAALFRLERTTWLKGAPVTFVRMTYHAGYQLRTQY
jgi:GntR family histidine utilization transcriptional repressor